MNRVAQCTVALELASHAEQIEDVEGLLQLLEQCFIAVFKKDSPQQSSGSSAPSPRDVASMEEEKMILTRAVKQFHVRGAMRHGSFLKSKEYYMHAALFIHELMNSLSGNSNEWFRGLQTSALEACQSVLDVLCVENVRACLPGIASATLKYIGRSHHGKDGVVVRVDAINVLHRCLNICFAQPADPSWCDTAAEHLSRSIGAVLNPTSIISCHFRACELLRLRNLMLDVLNASALAPDRHSPLFREVIAGLLVVDNMCHLQQLGGCVAEEVDTETPPDGDRGIIGANAECERREEATRYEAFQKTCANPMISRFVFDTLQELRGVPMIHAATTTLRLPFLRQVVLSCGASDDSYALFQRLMERCMRLVGTEFSADDFYTSGRVRRYPTGVVDEFLETLAHALAEMPFSDSPDDDENPTPGERLTNGLLGDAEEMLENWDLYVMHPPTIYVLSRVVVWQFKPLPSYLEGYYFSSASSAFPAPVDFVECGVLEQLWTVVGLPHLWNIMEDEESCNAQQIAHRRLVASTTLRVLHLVAEDVLQRCPRNLASSTRAFDRVCALTLYAIMQKASVAGIVHETAIQCLEALAAASGEAGFLHFFSRISVYVVDEASRAIKDDVLRRSVTSVLVGAVKFLFLHVTRQQRNVFSASSGNATSNPDGCDIFATSGLALSSVVRHRLAVVSVRRTLSHAQIDAAYLSKSAEFATTICEIVSRTIKLAHRSGDELGLRALLILARDTLDIAALLNFSAPLESFGVDDDRHTTSADDSIKKMQCVVYECIHVLQTHTLHASPVVEIAVQTVVRGLTCFLTSSAALEQVVTPPEGEGEGEDEGASMSSFVRRPPKLVEWFGEREESEICLPRTLLSAVYQTYLPLLSLLKEPISQFVTTASTVGQRHRVEQKMLLGVKIREALFSALSGLHSLLLLAEDFLQDRFIKEVLPVASVWYERALLAAVPTASEIKAKQHCKDFFDVLRCKCDRKEEVDHICTAVEENTRSFFKITGSSIRSKPAQAARGEGHAEGPPKRDSPLTREDLFIGSTTTV